jgi:hypothetical protein
LCRECGLYAQPPQKKKGRTKEGKDTTLSTCLKASRIFHSQEFSVCWWRPPFHRLRCGRTVCSLVSCPIVTPCHYALDLAAASTFAAEEFPGNAGHWPPKRDYHERLRQAKSRGRPHRPTQENERVRFPNTPLSSRPISTSLAIKIHVTCYQDPHHLLSRGPTGTAMVIQLHPSTTLGAFLRCRIRDVAQVAMNTKLNKNDRFGVVDVPPIVPLVLQSCRWSSNRAPLLELCPFNLPFHCCAPIQSCNFAEDRIDRSRGKQPQGLSPTQHDARHGSQASDCAICSLQSNCVVKVIQAKQHQWRRNSS